MALCTFSSLVGGLRGASSDFAGNVECVAIGQCAKDIHGHLAFFNISDNTGVNSESKLLFNRAGKAFSKSYRITYGV